MAKKAGSATGRTSAKSEGLGERIRAMRSKLGMELETLAEKAGFTPEYLGQIEEGKTPPPVGALIRISRALAVDTSALLAEGQKKERRQSYRKRTEAYSYACLTPNAEDKHLWAYLVTLEPKKVHDKVEYRHEGEEFVYVLEGRVGLQIGDEEKTLKKGATLHFNSALPHTLKNLSSKESKLLVVVYTP
jgi:transcriptional regulator with XRE-family HTH domain